MRVVGVIGSILAGIWVAAAADDIKDALSTSQCANTIERDVAIIGGGASGTYAAVQLREIYNKSVVVIETKDQLGGAVATYTDPLTGTVVNYGVVVYNDYGNSKKFFDQMNVSTQPRVAFSGNITTMYIDPYTGHQIQNYTAPPMPQVLTAMSKLHELVKQYDDILLPGYWNFPAGKDIPGDLLLPWSEFVAKYNIQDVFNDLKRIAGPDGRPDQLMLHVITNFNSIVIRSYLEHTSFDPKPFDTMILYRNLQKYLGEDAMVATRVIKTKRTDNGVTLVARGADGRKTCIRAKQLLITAQPSLKNLQHMDLDKEEKYLFSTWTIIGNFAFVIRTNFIPADKQITFMSTTSEDLPFNLALEASTIPNLYRVKFSSQYKLYTMKSAHEAVVKHMKQLVAGGLFKNITENPTFEIVAESDFTSPFYNQTVALLKDNFMQRQYALQGKRSTWYTGGLWCSSFTANVWAFTDTVLPRMMKQLDEKAQQQQQQQGKPHHN